MEKLKLLIVDDDTFNIDILLLYFEDLNDCYITYTANSGEEAIDSYCKYSPNVVLLDVVLPDASGLDLCKEIKDNSSETKVILISGRAMPEDIKAGYDAGADHYLSKPYYTEDLIKLIED